MITFLILLSVLIMLYGLIGIIVGFIPLPENSEEVHARNLAFRKGEEYTAKSRYIKLPFKWLAAFGGFILIILFSMIVKVGPQEVGVLVRPTGVVNVPLHTGWNVVAPWNEVHLMDKTVWVYTCTDTKAEGAKDHSDAIWAPTKDGIKMGIDISLSWRINPEYAPWIYQNVTENDGGNSGRYIWLEENVIRTKIKSALALSVSNFTPIEVYSTKREAIQADVMKRIQTEVGKYHLIVDQVDIREVYYNADYEKAINNKKLAEQEALRLVDVTKQKDELLKQAVIEKDIAIQKAEGESKALQIKGNSITNNPKIIELEWISKWNGKLPEYMMGSGQGVMINLKN
jgi:regulator of protease activity HflC (stomatin/prohibitin superfamily)